MSSVRRTLRDVLQGQTTAQLTWILLSSGDDELRRRVCRELGRRRAVESTDLLLRLAAEARGAGRWDLLEAALESLGELEDARAGSLAVEVLANDSLPVAVRDTAAYALAKLNYPPAIAVLLNSLSDSSRTVRICSAAALASMNDASVLTRLRSILAVEADVGVKKALARAIEVISRGSKSASPGWMNAVSAEPGTVSQMLLPNVAARYPLVDRLAPPSVNRVDSSRQNAVNPIPRSGWKVSRDMIPRKPAREHVGWNERTAVGG